MGDSDRGQLKFAWEKFDAAAPWMCWSKAAALLLAQWSGLERENRIKRQMQFLHFVQTVDCLILLSLTRSFRVRVPFCLCAFASHKWGTKEATECFSSLLLMHACLLACRYCLVVLVPFLSSSSSASRPRLVLTKIRQIVPTVDVCFTVGHLLLQLLYPVLHVVLRLQN